MEQPIEIKEYPNGIVAEIRNEPDPQDPREWDNVGTMVCSHKRYSLGDKYPFAWDAFESWETVQDALVANEGPMLILPLYMMDHSGLTVATHPFGGEYGRWDSGQIGFIFVTEKKYKSEGFTEEQARSYLLNEVTLYNQYLQGDCYYFTVKKKTVCPHCLETKTEILDSCGGYYGTDFKENGIYDAIEAEVKNA